MGTSSSSASTGRPYGVCSMVAPLRRVAMRSPGAILSAEPERWHYAKAIDPDALSAQYRHFAELVAGSGTEIVWLPDDGDDDLADSIFTYDPSFTVPDGAVILRPGKALRDAEADLHQAFYEAQGIPVLGRIEAPGCVEGGDLFWVDGSTLAVGRGFRTNQAGIEQLAALVAPSIELVVFDLPYFRGPEACLHLLSVISPLDVDLALVHAPLLPTALYELLVERGWELLVAPEAEFEASLGLNLNVLATAPRRCIAVDGFPATVELMRSAGCEVEVFDGSELCIPCEGGPTCLTRPLLRS